MKILLLITVLFAVEISIQEQRLRTKHFNLEESVAMEGYDPMGYFLQHKALKGRKDISWSYEGVTYYFASQANRELFKADPGRYEPRYGGWCAYAMGASGGKVEVDPETFRIIDGRLYLFYNRFFNNTLSTWLKDEAHLRLQADRNWVAIYR